MYRTLADVLTDPLLTPMFHRPSRMGVASAWYGHVPFGMWLVAQTRPRILVELGTHAGVSYSAFCEAVQTQHLHTRCYAVDTWHGDEHSGLYGEEVFADLARFNEQHYRDFSTLLRMPFDDALTHMADGSIDLLHIDGLHTYEAVSHDFNSWRPKLSDRAVVLLHDTNVRRDDFGVWRLWRELAAEYPAFEFLHANGLGVLAVGSNAPESIRALCQLDEDQQTVRVREAFALLGERWEEEARRFIDRAALEACQRSASDLTQTYESLRKEHERTVAALRLERAALERTRATLETMRAALERATIERNVIRNSTIWQMTEPLRRLGNALPGPVRRGFRPMRRGLRRVALGVLHPGRAMRWPAAYLRRELQRQRVRSPGPVPESTNQPCGVSVVSGEPTIPGHAYRVARLADALRSVGATVAEWEISGTRGLADEVARAEIIYLWRVSACPESDAIIAAARSRGARLVFDVDDLMFDPDLASADIIDAIRSQALSPSDVALHFERVRSVLLAADFCTCSTEELATRIRALDKPTFVIPNGFDARTHAVSRLAARKRSSSTPDGLIRIGYAAGTLTHQRDFATAADALARVLADNPQCRLVLFRDPTRNVVMMDLNEFPSLAAQAGQVEWRDIVPVAELCIELARFDINLAPLEVGNAFVEAKSELKYFEAALVGVCTVASPTGPMRNAIRDGETGILAGTEEEWHTALQSLVQDATLRKKLARHAYLDVLYRYGPYRRADLARSLLQQISGGVDAARAFELELLRSGLQSHRDFDIPDSGLVFSRDRLGEAEVTVVIPLYNYASHVAEALDSVKAQTIDQLDLVIVDDASTDDSLNVALAWAEREAARFNRIQVFRNTANAGLARTRNVGFEAAETPFVVPLDADNRLLPEFCSHMLNAIRDTLAAFAYPRIQCFGMFDHVIGTDAFSPLRFASGNYVDAMALVAKWAWAAVGGYTHIQYGWEDYDFWCTFVENGLWGIHVPEILAEYRMHGSSMLRTTTDIPENKRKLMKALNQRHKWLSLTYRD